AAELDLDPGLVLNKTLIQAIAILRPERRQDLAALEDIRRWRCKAFGQELVALMKSFR
ncbi:MAG: HRDC domain-containing protein, partial [Desulfosarcina sp.]|nr:HRDC domain-containing protein [Desulfobacterales bacterium]